MPAWLSDWRRLLRLFYALSPSCSLSPLGKCRPLLGCMLRSASSRVFLCRARCSCELVFCVLSYRVYVFLCHTGCFSVIQDIRVSLSYRVYVFLCHTGYTVFLCHTGYTCYFIIQVYVFYVAEVRPSLLFVMFVFIVSCHTLSYALLGGGGGGR